MSNLVLLLGSTSTNYQFKNWSASSENNTISKQHSVILYHGIRSIIKLKLRLSGWWDIMSPCIVNISPVVKTRYVKFFYMLTNSYLPSFYMKRHPSIIKDILVDIYIRRSLPFTKDCYPYSHYYIYFRQVHNNGKTSIDTKRKIGLP